MKRDRGFTLTELMVVVAISAILLTVALPQFRDTALRASRAEGTQTLVAALAQARGAAIAGNAAVAVCHRDYFADGARCGSGPEAWQQGWIVYGDSPLAEQPASEASVMSVFEPVGGVTAGGDNDAFRIVTDLADPGRLEFLPSGRAAQSASFTFCDNDNRLSDGRRVEVAASGRVSVRKLDATEKASVCAAS